VGTRWCNVEPPRGGWASAAPPSLTWRGSNVPGCIGRRGSRAGTSCVCLVVDIGDRGMRRRVTNACFADETAPSAPSCRNVLPDQAADYPALDVAHGVPPPRAAPPLLRRVVLSRTSSASSSVASFETPDSWGKGKLRTLRRRCLSSCSLVQSRRSGGQCPAASS
jgi:hypothetical protein